MKRGHVGPLAVVTPPFPHWPTCHGQNSGKYSFRYSFMRSFCASPIRNFQNRCLPILLRSEKENIPYREIYNETKHIPTLIDNISTVIVSIVITIEHINSLYRPKWKKKPTYRTITLDLDFGNGKKIIDSLKALFHHRYPASKTIMKLTSNNRRKNFNYSIIIRWYRMNLSNGSEF